MIRFGGITASLALIATVTLCGCSRLPTQMAGGSGSETVFGKARMPSGSPAAKAIIRLRPAGYLASATGLPVKNAAQQVNAVADDSGRFSVLAVDAGLYCLEINNNAGLATLLKLTIDGSSDSADLGVAILEKTASVLGTALDAAGGKAQIFGLERLASIDSVSGAFSFSDLPAGIYSFRLVPETTPSVFSISSIKLDAGDVQNVSLMRGWTSLKRIYFNTTATGANVAGNVMNFPVLVRLTHSSFDFSQAQAGGADLRFTKQDNMPFPYEIERWDSSAGLAEVWVKIDTIFGNDSTHFITMFWGASTPSTGSGTLVTSASNSAAVFDTSAGFQGVWHLQETGKISAPDATGNHFDGVPSDTAPTSIPGPIGLAQQFNGTTNYISIAGTANSVLNFPENGTYSLSAWVKVNPFPNQSSVIVSKQLYQYSLQLRNDNFWEFHIFDNTIGFESTSSAASSGVWTHVEGVRSGTNQYFYVNGTLCASIAADTMQPGNTTYSRITANDVCIGRLPVINNPGQTWRYFTGAIEEVRISSVANNANWIKLCYMNQRSDDKLVVLK
jgi:Concanavalin A-like lectin/glucanases superfamily/Domain of unknown function (DUF2341)